MNTRLRESIHVKKVAKLWTFSVRGWGGSTPFHSFRGCLSDPGVPGVRSMGPVLSHSQTELPLLNLNDVTLADEDTNSILTDNANRAMQVTAMDSGGRGLRGTTSSETTSTTWLPLPASAPSKRDASCCLEQTDAQQMFFFPAGREGATRLWT